MFCVRAMQYCRTLIPCSRSLMSSLKKIAEVLETNLAGLHFQQQKQSASDWSVYNNTFLPSV